MKAEEDWSDADLDVLLSTAFVNLDESSRCHGAGAPRAALVMLAGTLECLLLATVVAHEDDLRAAGLWPPRPSREHLSDLARLARRMGWLSAEITDGVIDTLNKARTMTAHPGAYVRAVRQVPGLDLDDPIGYQVLHQILVTAYRALAAVHTRTTASGPVDST